MEIVQLFSKVYGEGRPLIILHGLFGMGDNWTTHAKFFATKGWQVHAVDGRNHGRSPHQRAQLRRDGSRFGGVYQRA